jgi:hypothetical protein
MVAGILFGRRTDGDWRLRFVGVCLDNQISSETGSDIERLHLPLFSNTGSHIGIRRA